MGTITLIGTGVLKSAVRVPRFILIGLLRAYQLLVSPFLGNHCRFYPSCSSYAVQALQRFGVFRGGYLALRRLSHCHPLCEGGIDYVPEKKKGAAGHG